MDHRIIYLFHILLVSPLFIYIWYITNHKKQKLDESLGILMLIIGIVIGIYHLYKFVKLQKLLS
jgi:hypothetical protein